MLTTTTTTTTTEATTAEPAPPGRLEYAPPPPSPRRRLATRIALWLLALAAVAGAVARWGPPAARRWELLSLQRKCLRYDPPPGAAAVFALGADDNASSTLAQLMSGPFSPVVPPAWTSFQPHLSKQERQSHGLLFLHERTSPAGRRRLVVIDLSVSLFNDGPEIAFDKAVVRPATWRTGPTWVKPTERPEDVVLSPDLATRQTVLSVPYGRPFELLPGRPDPADASRFTISFRHGDEDGVIDGQLCDDDTVTLAVRGAAPRKHASLPVRLPAAPPNAPGVPR